MRLTGKNETGYYSRDNDLSGDIPSATKLGQLEDIEEELGIDLSLRHKVETSEKLYCRDDKGNLIETRYYYSYGKDGVGLELPMETEPYYRIASYPWKDYGKTWGLEKKDLE